MFSEKTVKAIQLQLSSGVKINNNPQQKQSQIKIWQCLINIGQTFNDEKWRKQIYQIDRNEN